MSHPVQEKVEHLRFDRHCHAAPTKFPAIGVEREILKQIQQRVSPLET